jgi:hypothetical protein
MKSVEIFKTTVKGKRNAAFLVEEMQTVFPSYKISIDLDDRDKVLRVETRTGIVKAKEIIELLERRNFNCEILNS